MAPETYLGMKRIQAKTQTEDKKMGKNRIRTMLALTLALAMVLTGVPGAFADVERYLGKCRFSDCRHQSEPGCAIRAALESGELDPAHWNNYLKLQAETQDSKTMLRRKREWSKSVAMKNKQRKF